MSINDDCTYDEALETIRNICGKHNVCMIRAVAAIEARVAELEDAIRLFSERATDALRQGQTHEQPENGVR